MSLVLLCIENLALSALLVAMLMSFAVRRKSRIVRSLFYGLAVFLPVIPVAALTVLCGITYFTSGLARTAFWSTDILRLATLVVCLILLIKASRRDPGGLPRAFFWPHARVAMAFLVCLALLCMTYWNLSLQTQVEIQGLRTQAGALALSVAPPPILDADNAALVYQQAVQSYNAATANKDKETDFLDLDPHSPLVATYLEQQTKTLELVRRAADMRAYRPEYNYASATETELRTRINDLGPFRALANLLVVAAKAQSAANHAELALDDCRRVHAMSTHIGSLPLLLNGQVSVALESMANKTAAKILPTVTSRESLDHFPLSDPEALSRMFNRCLRNEEAFSLARFCDFATGLEMPGADDAADQMSPARTAGLWMLWLREDLMHYREGMQRIRTLTEQPFYKSQAELKHIHDEANASPGKFRLSSMALGALSTTMQPIADAQALRACTTLAFAATRYRLAHNQYPENAQALVPEFLDAIPLDPFDGQPLRYLLSPDKTTLTLYSLGRDLTDNHGDIEPKKNGPRPPDTGFTLKPTP